MCPRRGAAGKMHPRHHPASLQDLGLELPGVSLHALEPLSLWGQAGRYISTWAHSLPSRIESRKKLLLHSFSVTKKNKKGYSFMPWTTETQSLFSLTMFPTVQGDLQMTALGLAVAALFFFVSRAEPLEKLSAERPPSRIFCAQVYVGR